MYDDASSGTSADRSTDYFLTFSLSSAVNIPLLLVSASTEHSPAMAANPPAHPVIVYDVALNRPQDQTPEGFTEGSPVYVLWRDFRLIVSNAWAIPLIFVPFPKPNVDITGKGIKLQVILTTVSLLITGAVVSSFFIGIPTPVFAAILVCAFTLGFDLYIGDNRVFHQSIPGDDKFEDETWLFVNGVATSKSGLILILNRLYQLFGRRVIGVHNRSYGFWFDLVECMLQRDFVWQTKDTRDGYDIISAEIAKPHKTKIVLMAHSQGGIILTSWIDQLLSDFSTDLLRKVEIYTFASAATHFSVPTANGQPVFARVEHFVNTKDFVSRIGLLAFAPEAPAAALAGANPPPTVSGRFAGRIFQRIGETGHLLLTHYLKEGNSILADPVVVANSWLNGYLQ
ncbi:hypothetical protein IAT38_006436 [Cryptococcus sp. DSM 104549]